MLQSTTVLIEEEGGKGYVKLHALEAGSGDSADDVRVREDAYNDKYNRGPYYSGVGIHDLNWILRQCFPREETKTVGEVMWSWSHHQSHQIMERLILELIITVVIPYYYILLFLLCRLATGRGGGEEIMIDKEHHWCEFKSGTEDLQRGVGTGECTPSLY